MKSLYQAYHEKYEDLFFDILGGKDNLSLSIDAKDFSHEHRMYVDKYQKYDKRESDFWSFKYGETRRYCYGLEIEYHIDRLKKERCILLTKYKYNHQDIVTFFKRYEVIPEERVELAKILEYGLGVGSIKRHERLIRTAVEEEIGISLDPFGQEIY